MREKFDVRRCVVQPMDPAYKEKFEQLTGPLNHTAEYGIGDVPLFVRAGSVIPMKTMASSGRLKKARPPSRR